MPKKKRTPPRCSLCGKTGHNVRTCSGKRKTKKKVVEKKSSKSNTEVQKNEFKKRQDKPHVFVRVSDKMEKSPHVINLKDEEREKFWQSIDAYNESKNYKKPTRLTVDFDGMVKKVKEQSSIDNKKLQEEFNLAIDQEKKNQKNAQVFKQPSFISHKAPNIKKRKKERNLNFFATISNWINSRIINIKNNFSFKRFAISSLLLVVILCLPFPAVGYYNKVKLNSEKIVAGSSEAFMSLQASTVAVMHSDIETAQIELNNALQSFSEVDSIIDREHQVLLYVTSLLPVVGNKISSRQHILTAGHHLALGNSYLVKGIENVSYDESAPFTEKLNILNDHLRGAKPQYQAALNDLNKVDPSALPVEYQQSFKEFKLLYAAFIDDIEDLENLISAMNIILGDENLKRYLVVFQNNNELRPTGGFMGSFAVVDVQKGKIMKMEVPGGGSYDLQGQLDVYVKPPLPLQLTNGRWEFQDANWFADFPASAQKMAWFYQHGRKATVDGVIAVNASVLERLIKVIGPLSATESELTLSNENALEELQKEVEVNYDKELNQPKAVIGELLDEVLANLSNANAYDLIRLLSEVYEAAEQKEIQVFFNDDASQDECKEFGWTGEIKEVKDNQDYLMVVNTNIQGQKSDAKIEQAIEHQSVVSEDGSIINTVFIRRKHKGIPGTSFYGVNNISYLRVYVPEGAELLDAGGFSYPPEEAFHVSEPWYEDDKDLMKYIEEKDIDPDTGTVISNQFGKTVFGNWTMVQPGDEIEVYFTYKLPFKMSFNVDQENINSDLKEILLGKEKKLSKYSLLTQKQSGINSSFSSTIIYPKDWQPLWTSRDGIEMALNGIKYDSDMKTDLIFAVIMENTK
ncbi:MAG: DUF4012 domain-containing protein [Candidatus Magasanikbacteria bacterium]|nr:DUF4012 domain-containing protein [Candidatus Magasanikbacteria bacterium]